MNSIIDFKRRSKEMNLCEEYSFKWDGCRTDKELIDMALGVKGVHFMAGLSATEDGLGTDAIKSRFGPYINGRYRSRQKGYNSSMYAGVEGGIIEADTTLLLAIGCNCTVKVPPFFCTQVYLDRGCKEVEILLGEGSFAEVYTFGDETKVTNSPDSKARPFVSRMTRYKDKFIWTADDDRPV